MGKHSRTRIERGIYQEHRKTGIRLVVRIQVEGRDRTKTMPAAATIEEAREVRRGLEAATRKGPAAEVMSVRHYVMRWLRLKQAQGMKPGALEQYIDVMGRNLLPAVIVVGDRGMAFGDLPILGVTRAHVVEWIEWASKQQTRHGQPYAAATLNGWWRPIRQMLRDAAAEYQMHDPTARLRGPSSSVRGVREGRTLTATQLGQLLNTVRRSWPTWADEIEVLALTGMRPGELYALQWGDINEGAGVIEIRRSVNRGRVGTPKSGKPRMPALTPRIAKLLATRRLLAGPVESTHLVFPARTGMHRGPAALSKPLRLAAKEAGISFRVGPQVLRRTFNTLNAQRGASGIVLRDQMGHTTEAMTIRYAGVHAGAKIAMVEAFEAEIQGADPEKVDS